MISQELITSQKTISSIKKATCSPKPLRFYLRGVCNVLPKRKHALSPAMGETCGRRERRTDWGTRGGAILRRAQVAAVEGTRIRYEVVSLRGWTIQSGSWSVRSGAESSFLRTRRTDDRECPLEARGGERRQRAQSARTLFGSRPTSTFDIEDTSFAHSRDPCLVSHGIAHAGVSLSRSGKSTKVEVTGTGGERSGTKRGSPHPTVLQGNARGVSRKRKAVKAAVRKRGNESSVLSVRTSWLVAEVGRQWPGLKSARMQRSKKGGDASERGPSGARVASERRKTRRSGSGRANGALVSRLSRSNDGRERPAETQDGVRTSPSGQQSGK